MKESIRLDSLLVSSFWKASKVLSVIAKHMVIFYPRPIPYQRFKIGFVGIITGNNIARIIRTCYVGDGEGDRRRAKTGLAVANQQSTRSKVVLS